MPCIAGVENGRLRQIRSLTSSASASSAETTRSAHSAWRMPIVPVTGIPRAGAAAAGRAVVGHHDAAPPSGERNARRFTGAEGAQELGEQLAFGRGHRPSLADRSGRQRHFHCLQAGMSPGAASVTVSKKNRLKGRSGIQMIVSRHRGVLIGAMLGEPAPETEAVHAEPGRPDTRWRNSTRRSP